MITVYKGFTAEELEAQYNLRRRRPDYDTAVIPRWAERSASARRDLNCTNDIAYGSATKQKLDLFRSADASNPLLIYFHGGYWQRGDKSIYSFLAAPFVKNGVNVIIAGYQLCPDVSITAISDQARKLLLWVWDNAGPLGVSVENLVVMGHSAGGHITGMLMGTDWKNIDAKLPDNLIKCAIPISPLNELQPLRFTSINDGVRMDAVEAASQSPMNNPPLTDAPQLVVCGERETDEFHRQADIYASQFVTPQRVIKRYTVPACDHFDELDQLAEEDSHFFRTSLSFIKHS
jgi:arylformamidase